MKGWGRKEGRTRKSKPRERRAMGRWRSRDGGQRPRERERQKKREKQSEGPSLKNRRDLGRVWGAPASGAASEPKSEQKWGSRPPAQGGRQT